MTDTQSPVVVLLHGMTGAPGAFDEVVAEVERSGVDSRWIRPFLPGHGPAPSIGLERHFLPCCVEFLRCLEGAGLSRLRRAHLVGYSLGARVGAALLTLAPDLWTGATLIGLNPGLVSESARQARQRQDEQWRRLLQQEGIAAFTRKWAAQPVLTVGEDCPAARQRQQARERLQHTVHGLSHAFEVLGLGAMPELGPLLTTLPFPVHLMSGAQDSQFTSLAQSLVPRLRHGSLTVVPGAGHNLVLERPDLVAQALLEGISP
jgi:2-succinyl-6-hydroxy-2,4-cyclohexadiene-1-carboxylate synthase